MKGLPLAYNKDMQEDKEGLFDALDTWLDCLHMAALVLDGIQVKRPRCQEAAQQGYANATELADYLVAKGVPFREAHHIVGEAVVEAIRFCRCNRASTSVRQKAASHRSRWRRRLLLRRLG